MAVCGSMFPFWPRIDPRLNQTFKGIIFVGTGVSHYFNLPFKVPGLGLQGLKSGTSVWCFNRQYQRNLYETVLKNIPVQWTKEIVGMPFVGLQFLHWNHWTGYFQCKHPIPRITHSKKRWVGTESMNFGVQLKGSYGCGKGLAVNWYA